MISSEGVALSVLIAHSAACPCAALASPRCARASVFTSTLRHEQGGCGV